MATGCEEPPNPDALVSYASLATAMANLEKSFFENMSIFFKPFYAQMEEMQKEVRETKAIAENARNTNLATQNEIQQLQQLEDVLAEKAIKTDMTLRQNNLKLRGLKEKLEKNEDLSEIISKWLEKEVPPTGNISPIITNNNAAKNKTNKRRNWQSLQNHHQRRRLQNSEFTGHHHAYGTLSAILKEEAEIVITFSSAIPRSPGGGTTMNY
ncbi:UNVERIFIED_CONTAM: hypothetical protein K2H54_058161 [Gekko kuhli]